MLCHNPEETQKSLFVGEMIQEEATSIQSTRLSINGITNTQYFKEIIIFLRNNGLQEECRFSQQAEIAFLFLIGELQEEVWMKLENHIMSKCALCRFAYQAKFFIE